VTAGLILWAHALAAILFTSLALDQWRRGSRAALIAASALTALWALAVAGIGPQELPARVVEGLRDLAWLWLGASLAHGEAGARTRTPRLFAFAGAAMLPVGVIVLAVFQAVNPLADAATLGAAWIGLKTLTALTGLLLLRMSLRADGPGRLGAAIAMLWGVDLTAFGLAWATGWSTILALARGAAMLGVGAAFALAAQPVSDRSLRLSRGVRMRALAAGAFLLYTALVIAATGVAASFGGEHARALQTAIIAGATASLIALVSTPWLRAWTRVVVEKNLFGHRYDYRTAWQRFTATLGRPGEDGPLPQRVVQAVADLIDAPAGLLLVRVESGLEAAAGWRWDVPGEPGGEALARHLERTGRVLELDRVRDRSAPPADVAAVPDWIATEPQAWAAVPLIHFGALVGVIVLARPPVSRPLDWEDFDLLRMAGHQAASYLAEDRAHTALADAARFDEFNRRFAFILHDIKNLASQLTLVARNAERHADNPAFRADMVATLRDSSERLSALIARLSNRSPATGRPGQPVDLAALADGVARARRAQHPVLVQADGVVLARADSDAVGQALGHLVQNAIDASPPGAPVAITAHADGGRAYLSVADCGAGMSPAFVRDQLFRPFASSKPGGFGLGAFEARQLVRAMGGDLTVESREGEGSRFRIELPSAQALEEAA
jgi:putative PEP-CTERM system histidine kinase